MNALDLRHAKSVVGYCDPLSAHPGETIRFMVSCWRGGEYEAQLVRTVCADVYPMGGGFEEVEVPSPLDGRHAGRKQEIAIGSWAEVAAVQEPASFTLSLWIHPTGIPRPQDVVRLGRIRLRIDERRAAHLEVGRGSLQLDAPLIERRWTRVVVRHDAESGRTRLSQYPRPTSPGDRVALGHSHQAEAILDGNSSRPVAQATTLYLADRRFNGRLARPVLVTAALEPGDLDALDPTHPLVAGWWDFSLEMESDRIVDRSLHGRSGRTHNLPTRAVPGPDWSGDVFCWTSAPAQYDAIHFHQDDLADAGWQSDFSFTVPDDLPSGLYAVRLRQDGHEDHVQFFVRPPRDRATAELLFLVPTATYLAYANHTVHLRPGPLVGEPPAEPLPNDATLLAHPELGLSHYDYHRDGSGVVFSSRQRPVMNLKSKNVPWGFVADTRLTAWLERRGIPFDVATDEDLHQEGSSLLRRYRALMTGTHPEYWSTAMLDALEQYLDSGGRMLYMGGNGFYWRVAFHPDHPGVMEVRRAEDGTRAWIAEPGEYHHAWGGELGGLWRRLGRPPNRICGVGFAAQGFGHTTFYRRTADADDPRASFLFAGIEAERLGDHGRLDSASGEEIDRYDARLGSPPHALVVATAVSQPEEMLRTKEEFHMSEPHGPDPEVRSDLVFFETPGGGAVLASGSINWAAALATNGYDNDVARLSENAVRRFLDPAPFPLPP